MLIDCNLMTNEPPQIPESGNRLVGAVLFRAQHGPRLVLDGLANDDDGNWEDGNSDNKHEIRS